MASTQAPRTVVMVRPDDFGYNPETAASNAFQHPHGSEKIDDIRSRALKEFDNLVNVLRASGVSVVVFDSPSQYKTPDAVFPNNWVSFHADGTVILYPMMATNRRHERRLEVITELEKQHAFEVSEIIDLSYHEQQELFLEGTGSLVIDYSNSIIYSNHSPRTSEALVHKVAHLLGCKVCLFHAVDQQRQDIYHTNVMMCIAERFAVICLEAIEIMEERRQVEELLQNTGHDIIAITRYQVSQFAGNMMELQNATGQSVLVMSQAAYESLDERQVERLQRYSQLAHSPVDTIEKYGGGSVRCMLAGVYLPKA